MNNVPEDNIFYPELLADGYMPEEINAAMKYCQDIGLQEYSSDDLRVLIKGRRKEQEEIRQAQLKNDKAAVDAVGFIHDVKHAVEIAGLMKQIVVDCTGQEPKHRKIRCTHHNDSDPSLTIYPDGVHCFACGWDKDSVGFWADANGISNQFEAAKQLNDFYHLGIHVPEPPKRKRGRPRKKAAAAATDTGDGADAKQEEDGSEKKPALTIESFSEWLEQENISIRLDEIGHKTEISGRLNKEYDAETLNGNLHIILHDELKQLFSCGTGSTLVSDLLNVIAGMNRYNPVLSMLEQAPPWDGKDRMPDIYSILNLDQEDELSRTLLHKWLWQSLALAGNRLEDAFGADGLLVLSGPQGVGKTSFVRAMGVKPELVKCGQYIDSKDKDTTRRVTSCWICELGEIETTLRSDIERLKAFITAEIDEYRLPYGRADVRLARRTSLIATCNSEKFLIDPTGSRRFWTVPVTAIDLDALARFDALQMWKQIEFEISGNRQCFRLTREEQATLAKRNTAHEKPLKSQAEIEDILADAIESSWKYTWKYITVSDFKSQYDILSRYSVEQIGKALDKIGIKQDRQKINGKVNRCRRLPCVEFSGQRYA